MHVVIMLLKSYWHWHWHCGCCCIGYMLTTFVFAAVAPARARVATQCVSTATEFHFTVATSRASRAERTRARARVLIALARTQAAVIKMEIIVAKQLNDYKSIKQIDTKCLERAHGNGIIVLRVILQAMFVAWEPPTMSHFKLAVLTAAALDILNQR